jgi:hypothetical protein
MTHLLGWQKNLDKMWRQKEDHQYAIASWYVSTFREPQSGSDDLVAKKTFSGYGYSQLWTTTTIKSSFYLQMDTNEDGDALIWTTNLMVEKRMEELTTTIKPGQRWCCER